MMEYAQLAPPPPLDEIVECVWFLRGPMDDAPPQTVVADGRMEIVLHLGEPFALVGDDGVARQQAEVLVAGQLTGPIQLAARGTADVVGIRFRPATARAVFRFPAHEVTGAVDPLAARMPRLAGALLDAAHRTSGSAGRVAALGAALARFVVQEPAPLIAEAMRSLAAAHPPPIRQLAARLGVTPRTLQRRVIEEVGVPPKMVHRVARFRRAFRLLDRTPLGRWAAVAAATGYYDQAHMIRDFRDFTGASPQEFFRTDPALSRTFAEGDVEAGEERVSHSSNPRAAAPPTLSDYFDPR
jgi:AraC-like DNA-binding protein